MYIVRWKLPVEEREMGSKGKEEWEGSQWLR